MGERQYPTTMTTNNRGQWVPAIPLPFYLGLPTLRHQCQGDRRETCGKKFWTMAGYRGHYALRHILGMVD